MMYSFENVAFPSNLFIHFENMIFSFENRNVSKNNKLLFRIYDLFIQEYTKVTPKWDELTFLNALGGSSQTNSFPKGAP